MSRKLKPQKVSSVQGGEARLDVYLDRNKLDFFARVGLEEVRAPSAKECEDLARGLARRWRPEAWKQVILVSEHAADDCSYFSGSYRNLSHGITLTYRRVERAARLDGSSLERSHELDYQAKLAEQNGRVAEMTREDRENLSDCTRLFDSGRDVELPYSDEAWAALGQIGLSIEEAARKLNEILRAPDAAKRLLEMGAGLRLLPEATAADAQPDEQDDPE